MCLFFYDKIKKIENSFEVPTCMIYNNTKTTTLLKIGKMAILSHIIAARRETVIQAYNSAKAENYLKYLEGDEKATQEYIYDNQIIDANNIVAEFYDNARHVISITKKTKVGMDGLMIEVFMLIS